MESRTVRFSSLVITTFRAQWNAAYVTLGNLLFFSCACWYPAFVEIAMMREMYVTKQ